MLAAIENISTTYKFFFCTGFVLTDKKFHRPFTTTYSFVYDRKITLATLKKSTYNLYR